MRAAWDFLKKTFSEFSEDDCASQAAALAYYTIFSMPAMLVIIVTIVGFLYPQLSEVTGEEAQAAAKNPDESQDKSAVLPPKVAGQFEMLIGKEGTDQLGEMLANANKGGRGTWATIIGIIVLLFGATGALAQLQVALNRAWEVQPDPEQGGLRSFLLKRIFSFAMLLGTAFLLLVSLLLTAAMQAFGDMLVGTILPEGVSQAWPVVVNILVSLVVITLLFGAIFKVLPDAEIRWRDVWVGAGVTAVLFVLGKFLIGLYIGNSHVASSYGAAGSMAILLVWIYYSSMILLIGAEFTQVWAKRYGQQIQPSPGAVRVVHEMRHIRGPGQMRPT
jgi:membrane protein